MCVCRTRTNMAGLRGRGGGGGGAPHARASPKQQSLLPRFAGQSCSRRVSKACAASLPRRASVARFCSLPRALRPGVKGARLRPGVAHILCGWGPCTLVATCACLAGPGLPCRHPGRLPACLARSPARSLASARRDTFPPVPHMQMKAQQAAAAAAAGSAASHLLPLKRPHDAVQAQPPGKVSS